MPGGAAAELDHDRRRRRKTKRSPTTTSKTIVLTVLAALIGSAVKAEETQVEVASAYPGECTSLLLFRPFPAAVVSVHAERDIK